MHAIWFSVIVPVMIVAAWIGPRLRATKVWMGITLVAILGIAVWLGIDLYGFVEARESSKGVGLRLIYKLLSETGKPFLQLASGCFSVALLSWRFSKSAISSPSEIETA